MLNNYQGKQVNKITNKKEPKNGKSSFLSRILPLVAVLLIGLMGGKSWGQTSTQNFGTSSSAAHTSTTASTSYIPTPTGTPTPTTYARAGSGGSPSINLTTTIPSAFTGAGAIIRAVASSSTSVTKVSPIVAYSGATEFYTSFKVLFGSSTGTNTATTGTWSFFQGVGANFSDNNIMTNNQTFVGLTFTYGTSGALSLAYINAGSSSTTGLTTTALAQATDYTIEIVGNNKSSGTINYTYNGVAQTVAVQKFDLYINGTKVGDDLTKNTLASNTSITSITFTGINSTSNVANIFLDNVVTYNAVPATIGASAPTLGSNTATSITNTTATLGATITATNGTVTASGVAYATTTSPTTPTAASSPSVTTATSFTTGSNVTGLTPQTLYYYRGFATNGTGTGYVSTDGSFRTLSNPPTVQPTSFSTTPANTSLTANWTTATFPGSGATNTGYLVIYATGTPTLSSANGTAPTAGVGTLVNITSGATLTTTINSLTNGTTYNLLLIPYTWDGTNAATYNYLTASARTTTGVPATTPTVTLPTSTSITNNAATLGGTVGSDGGSAVTERGIVYSLTATNNNPLISGTGVTKLTTSGTTGLFTLSATGLTVGSGYSYKAYATNSYGTTYTTVATFNTSTTPSVTTPTSASITTSTATLGGNVTSDGNSAITERGVVYSLTSTNSNPQISGTGVTKVTASGTTGVFTTGVTGLTAGSGYSYAAYATNVYGTIYSSVSTFTTSASNTAPVVGSPTSASITNNSASIGGNVTSDGGAAISERGVVYALTSVNSDPLISGTGVTKTTSADTTGVFSVGISSLSTATGYSYKAYAINSVGTTYTSVATFTTLSTTPTITTPTSASILATSAILGGNVTSDGGSAITERGVVYSITSTNASPAISGTGVTKIIGSGTTGVFTISASSLTGNTGYSYAAYAINANGTVYTSISTFTTASIAPSITSPTSASVTNTTATLGGNVTSDGGSVVTERGIVYSLTGTNANPQISGTGVTKVTASDTTGVFTTSTTGLTAGSGYSYTAYATNANGTTYTSVSTFTTLTTPTVTSPTSASINYTTATLGGNVTSDGGSTITEIGVVYSITSTNNNPLISGTGVTKVTGSGTTGVFTINATSLTNSTGYSYKAYAINTYGTTYSAVSTFTTLTPAVPSAPTISSITSGNQSLSINYNAGSSNGATITDYKYSTDNGVTFKSASSTANPLVITTVSTSAATLSNSTSYNVQIKAVNNVGDGAASATTAATPGLTNSNTVKWLTTGNGTAWMSGSNWVGGSTPTSTDVAQFDAQSGNGTTAGITFTSDFSILGIELTSSRPRVLTLGGTGGSSSTNYYLTLTGGVINTTANTILRNASTSLFTIQPNNSQNYLLNLVLGNATSNCINIDGTGGITITAPISSTGSGSLVKAGSGAGDLTLSTGNTYTGKTIINSGYIATTGESAFGANPGSFTADQITLNGGGVKATGGSINFSSNRGITLGTNGGNLSPNSNTITLTNVVTGTGGLTVTSAGNISFPSGTTHTYTGTTTLTAGTTTLSKAQCVPTTNDFVINGGTLVVATNQTIDNLTISSGTLTVNAGITLTINGTLTYTGGTISSTGTIVYGTNGALSIGAGKTTGIEWTATNTPSSATVSAGTYLLANNVTTSGSITLSGTGVLDASASNYSITVGSSWTSYGQAAFTERSGTVTFTGTGNINTTGGENFFILTKSTGGTTTLASNVALSGTGSQFNLSAGTLDAGTNTFSGTSSTALNISGGTLKLGKLNTTLPEFANTTFNITSGTIDLNGAGTQSIQGGRTYSGLSFSTSGTKSITSTITTVSSILIQDAAVVSVNSNSFGGSTTTFTMTGTSRFITAGTGSKPDAAGAYSLASGTTIEFTNTAGTQQDIRLTPTTGVVTYANIDVSGSNVGLSGPSSALTFQNGSTFQVTSTGTFNVQSSTGFTGAAGSAIPNTNSPTVTLATGSTINYNSSSQPVTGRSNYSNLTISGSGTKTISGNTTIAGNLSLASGTLVVGGNTLNIAGNITRTSGLIDATNASASLVLNGTLTQSIANSSFTGTVNSLTITNNNAVNNSQSFTASTLTLGTNGTANGTWGSSASSATYKNATYLGSSATGLITVSNNTAITPTVTVTPIGTYTFNGNEQGPNAATNTGTGSNYTFSYANSGGTSYGPSATRPTNAGNYSATATVEATIDGFYNQVSSSPTAFSIGTAALTVTASAQSKTYGATAPTSGTLNTHFTVSGLQNTDAVSGATLGYSGSPAGNLATATIVGSPYTITPSAVTFSSGSSSNYTISYNTGNLTVNAGAAGTWVGVTSTDFSSASNWGDITIPNTGAAITIPSGTPYTPILTSSISLGSININSGATFGLGGQTLTITGAITSSATATLTGTSTSSLVIAGTAGTIYFTANADTIKDLTLTNGASVTLGDTLKISSGAAAGTVTVDASATLITGGFLTLQSDASSTAKVANSTGTISGDVTVERYIPSKSGRYFSFLASPVTQTVFNSWQQQMYVTGAGTGGQTCGSTSNNGGTTDKYNSNWFDKTNRDVPSIYTYNATPVNGSRWVSIPNTNATNLTPGIGYRVNVRGDRTLGTCADQLNGVTPAAPIAVTLKATGAIGQGNKTVTLNSISSSLLSLVGNPYPSPIDFATLASANTVSLYPNMWTLSPSSSGNYTTYNNGVTSGAPSGYSDGLGNTSFIASGQAFFVQSKSAANGGTGSLNFTEGTKTTGVIPNTAFFGTANNQLFRITLANAGNSKLDEAVVRFNTKGTIACDANWDALSLSTANQTLATMKAATKLAIATHPVNLKIDTVQLSLTSTTVDSLQLVFSDYQGIDSTTAIVLRDKFLGVAHDVRANQVYNFTVTNDAASKGNSRFEVVFTKGGTTLPVNFTSINAVKKEAGVAVNWKVAQQINIAKYNVERSIDKVNFTSIAKVNAASVTDYTITDYTITDSKLPDANVVYYRIQSVEQNGTKAYSQIAQVSLNIKADVASIYPNPVKEVMNVSINANENTAYSLRILNLAGKEVANTNKAKIVSKQFSMNVSNLAGGVYMVEFTNAKGEKALVKMIKE